MIRLEYIEEAEDSKYPEPKYKCKNLFVYDLEHNDFRVEVSGERVDIEFTGAEIRKEYGDKITTIKVTRDYDGLTIEHLDSKGIVYCKSVIRDYAFDWFEIRSMTRLFKTE